MKTVKELAKELKKSKATIRAFIYRECIPVKVIDNKNTIVIDEAEEKIIRQYYEQPHKQKVKRKFTPEARRALLPYEGVM